MVTGIVQEFQFGMNWSEYSRFVGDVFGAPLAIEGLAAFFLESTFLGLWIFGWDRLPRKLHLATIWIAAAGTWLSAYFILAANSFMQHPVGVRYNAERGRAELTSIWRLLTNNTALATFPHTIAGALLVAGTLVAAISTWWAVRAHRAGDLDVADAFRPAIRLGLVALLIGGVAVVVSGDAQAKLMFQQQPMKMAAAEALCHTETGAGFSLIAMGDVQNRCNVRQLKIPGLTSFLADGSFDSTLQGVDELQAAVRREVRPGQLQAAPPRHLLVLPADDRVRARSARPSPSLRCGSPGAAGHPPAPGWAGSRSGAIPAPFLANAFGWIFTEMGRQPWVVAPNPTGVDGVRMLVRDGVSPVSARDGAHLADRPSRCSTAILAVVWFTSDAPLRGRGRCRRPRRPTAAPRTTNARSRSPTDPPRPTTPHPGAAAVELTTVWFLLIAVLWTGYFVLEGFDFGVGMLLPVLGRDSDDDPRPPAS